MLHSFGQANDTVKALNLCHWPRVILAVIVFLVYLCCYCSWMLSFWHLAQTVTQSVNVCVFDVCMYTNRNDTPMAGTQIDMRMGRPETSPGQTHRLHCILIFDLVWGLTSAVPDALPPTCKQKGGAISEWTCKLAMASKQSKGLAPTGTTMHCTLIVFAGHHII